MNVYNRYNGSREDTTQHEVDLLAEIKELKLEVKELEESLEFYKSWIDSIPGGE